MTSLDTTSGGRGQLTLNFELSLVERHPTLREFLAHRVQVQPRPAKTIAMEMDMSPSLLSRKLSQHEGDTQRFNVDDLERYLQSTGDTLPIEYLAAKYLTSDATRQARAVARVEALAADLERALATLRQAA